MIKKENFSKLLEQLNFKQKENGYIKKFPEFRTELKVDFDKELLIYPEKDGLTINERQTCNFKQAENFVVFECVHRLLTQGYNPKHIELEPKWKVGHGASGGRADVLVKDNNNNALLIIECKTAGLEFDKAWRETQVKPTQLFSYVVQVRTTKFIALYASDFVDGEVKSSYYLMNMFDNEKLLESDKTLKSYKEAHTVEEIYAVWSQTYQKEYATKGLFEESQPYHIGKDRYSIDDLETVTSRDIQGKYHEFATIMRQHNVSGRENAFDKLVNLFLCKVVDETNNPNELKFYWKGVAYDDPFSLQDRLNHLYKVGMKKFLGEDITYIENQQIDDAFSVFRDKPNMTKEIIQGFFKELKFFTNNDFAFVDVHNKELFYKNFEVLLKIVKMLQDIKLTGGEDNQFLGDMFEGFLDQGVKQSEGQFFTPMPIVKFIINSLPIEKILRKEESPKAIDYACGAGHFLNEVANNFPKELHKNIVGVEKEYRLSKVAKVSAFMYGQDDVQIVYRDALSPIDEIKDSDYSLLVANPPYSVKGFLETLSQKERANYELLNALDEKSYTSNNAIECFFIERAKQLLKKDALAGIILPSSILSKGSKNNIYVHTREILLKYFDIVAIAEFGSGTFGKTGTNTVTLFLKRKADNPNMAQHLKYMVQAWFDGDFAINEHFRDRDLLAYYSSHIEVDLELYKSMLENRYNERLFELEMFAEYKQEFEKLTETKNRKKQRYYKALTADKKKEKEQKELLSYIRLIEEDKLYYFCLAYINPKEILIIKAPSDGAKNKKFLGYEWSGRKGDEGIKYITSTKSVKLEGAEVLENIMNLNNIETPLYNPQNRADKSKINSLIARNFGDEVVEIPQELEDFVTKAKLVDMLDFSRKEFSKAIGLSPNRRVEIDSKWKLTKLGKIAPYVTDKINVSNIDIKNYITTDNILQNRKGIVEYKGVLNIERVTEYQKNDILLSNIRPYLKKIWMANKKGGCSNDILVFRSIDSKKFLPEYLFYILSSDTFFDYVMSSKKGIKMPRGDKKQILQYPIPSPNINIQKEIVKACKIVDDEVERANSEIKKYSKIIEQKFQEAYTQSEEIFKLSDSKSFKVSIGKRILQKEITKDKGIPVYSANVFEIFGYIEKELIKEFSLPSVLWGIDGDWMVNYMPENKQFYPTDHCGVLRVINDKLHPRYVAWVLNKKGIEARFSRTLRASIDRIKGVIIETPKIAIQNKLIEEVNVLETKITKAKTIIEGASQRKESVLKEYL
jgi:type I restriction-modification system DNA methylase subunit